MCGERRQSLCVISAMMCGVYSVRGAWRACVCVRACVAFAWRAIAVRALRAFIRVRACVCGVVLCVCVCVCVWKCLWKCVFERIGAHNYSESIYTSSFSPY